MPPTTRDAMVEAAASLVDEGGPAAVTFRAVGERVGLSHNAAFKVFRDKEALLAAVASSELRRQATRLTERRNEDAGDELHTLLRGYIRWARTYPARFKLTFGSWTGGNSELGEAAGAATAGIVDAVRGAQTAGSLRTGDPERIAALLLATAHGAADLALNGHLSRNGKWSADPADLLDELFALLAPAAG